MIFIAGPCAAETREQVLSTAEILSNGGVTMFRASAWKPRTRAGSFEGVGEVGLKWLADAKERFGIRVITEIDCASNVELLTKYGIDACWIGARTSCSPFTVSELASALSGRGIEVFVKNPVCADPALWIGAVERLFVAGVEAVNAIHRGFVQWGSSSQYRNEPIWDIVDIFRSEMPDVPMICDPSHIAGRADLVADVARQAIDRGADGLMVECHPNPAAAKSDAAQQLTPHAALQLLNWVS